MIYVDDRAGSDGLHTSLKRAGLPVGDEPMRLDYGNGIEGGPDVMFIGRGENGSPLTIAVEHKTLRDFVSSIRTNRLQGHQLRGLRGDGAPFDFVWLVIEGEILFDKQGTLLRRTGPKSTRTLEGQISLTEFYKRLTVLHICGGLNWVHFDTRGETVKWFEALYRTWTDKDLDEHRSHLALYNPPQLVALGQFEETVGTLPGLGRSFAKSARERFGSIRRAINATVMEWAELKSRDSKGKERRLGSSTAEKIVEAVS